MYMYTRYHHHLYRLFHPIAHSARLLGPQARLLHGADHAAREHGARELGVPHVPLGTVDF